MILGRYLASHLLRGWLLVFVILSTLFMLLALIDEIDSLSVRYRFAHALVYVLLTTPQRILDLSPVIAALGTLTAFASLSRHSELVVMRTAGLSMRRLLVLCALPTAALVVGIGVASEFVVASLHHRAETQRMVLRSGNLDLLAGRGLWSRSEQRVLNLRELRVGQRPEGIRIYEFNADGSLSRSIEASRGEPLPDRSWRLTEVRTKEWHANSVDTRSTPSLDIGPFWSAAELPTLGQSLAAMPPSALWTYAEHLHNTGQDDSRVRMAFWQKLALPWSAGAMVLLCAVIGIGFGSTRSAAYGLRILAGATIGTGFYLLTQIMHTGGQLLELGQPTVVALPIVVVLIAALGLAAHTRRPR